MLRHLLAVLIAAALLPLVPAKHHQSVAEAMPRAKLTFSKSQVLAPVRVAKTTKPQPKPVSKPAEKPAEATPVPVKAEPVQAPTPAPVAAPVAPKAVVPQTTNIAGTKQDWMTAAGIPPNQWVYVDFIVSHESGWNPNAVNAGSGACGLGQQLPCGKWAGSWNDPVAALKAMTGYVGRYGGWAGAYLFWQANHWY